MGDLVPFVAAVAAFAGVGVAAGILIARRVDRWEAMRDAGTEPDDDPEPGPEAPATRLHEREETDA